MKRVAVDLSPLSPGGFNGGIKTAVYATLRYIEDRPDCGLRLEVYARPAVQTEIAPLLKTGVSVACEEGDVPEGVATADVCYCPVGYSAFLRAGKPTIALIADTLHRDHPLFLPPDQVATREALCRETLQNASRIQAISQWTADQICQHFQYPADRVFVARPLVHDRWAQFTGPAVPPAAPYFIYPANYWPHKNHETLLVAYRIYRDTCGAAEKAWPLILTGFPDDRQRYLQHIAAVLALDGIRFAGHVTDADLGKMLHAAGALVFPSVYEGLGMPLLEAMAVGCPVITGYHAAIPETTGNAALLVETRNPVALAEAMGYLARNSHCRAALTATGFAHAKACNPTIEFSRLLVELSRLGD